MTNPGGRCFISYRRNHAGEIALLVSSLHEHGVPTWVDTKNLASALTETEIRKVLADPNTASAVMFITKDVEHSPIIKSVEAPEIVKRASSGDSFYAVPIAADGLDFGDAANLFNGHIGVTDLKAWNITKVSQVPMDPISADTVSKRVLSERLQKLQSYLKLQKPLSIWISTWSQAPNTGDYHLLIDWSNHFSGRTASPSSWKDRIVPAAGSIAELIASICHGRRIEIRGQASLSSAFLFGVRFLAPKGVNVWWVQTARNGQEAAWGLRATPVDSGLNITTTPQGNASAKDLTLLVSVNGDIENEYAQMNLSGIRAVIHAKLPALGPGVNLDAGQSLDVAQKAIDALRDAKTKYRADGVVHVFMALPVGLAFMLGQLVNTFGTIQLYEQTPGNSTPYEISLRISL